MNDNPKHARNQPVAPQPFVPQTMIVPGSGGVQIIACVAPQVSVVTAISIEQLKEAMEKCLQLRQDTRNVLTMPRQEVGV